MGDICYAKWYYGHMSAPPLSIPDSQLPLLMNLARRYLWWEPVGDEPHSPARAVVQIMNMGTYEDIRKLERLLSSDHLVDAMIGSQPGWFSPRSWEFWRGRLSLSSSKAIPENAPRRSLSHAAML